MELRDLFSCFRGTASRVSTGGVLLSLASRFYSSVKLASLSKYQELGLGRPHGLLIDTFGLTLLAKDFYVFPF
jgi:hypothetical protein